MHSSQVWNQLSRLQQRVILLGVALLTLLGVYTYPHLFQGDHPPSKEDIAALNRIHRIEEHEHRFNGNLEQLDQVEEEFRNRAKEHLEKIQVRPKI